MRTVTTGNPVEKGVGKKGPANQTLSMNLRHYFKLLLVGMGECALPSIGQVSFVDQIWPLALTVTVVATGSIPEKVIQRESILISP